MSEKNRRTAGRQLLAGLDVNSADEAQVAMSPGGSGLNPISATEAIISGEGGFKGSNKDQGCLDEWAG